MVCTMTNNVPGPDDIEKSLCFHCLKRVAGSCPSSLPIDQGIISLCDFYKEIVPIEELYKKFNGRRIRINDHEYTIHYSEFCAVYPHPHKAVYVSLEPKNKLSSWYLQTKNKLGDHWITDGLSLGDDSFNQVYYQLSKMN